jgi:hypothetical protein
MPVQCLLGMRVALANPQAFRMFVACSMEDGSMLPCNDRSRWRDVAVRSFPRPTPPPPSFFAALTGLFCILLPITKLMTMTEEGPHV